MPPISASLVNRSKRVGISGLPSQVSAINVRFASCWSRFEIDEVATVEPTLIRIKLDLTVISPIKMGDMKTATKDTLANVGERIVVRTLLARLRAHRLRRNWTQAELARRAGISVQSYQNFETGYGNITLANLLRILGIFGFTDRLSLLVPEIEEERTLRDVIQPARQRARAKNPRPAK